MLLLINAEHQKQVHKLTDYLLELFSWSKHSRNLNVKLRRCNKAYENKFENNRFSDVLIVLMNADHFGFKFSLHSGM